MILRNLLSARSTRRRVQSKNWDSVRLVLANDDLGFSFHITTIYAGTETRIQYLNHAEAVYCISGEGEVVTLADHAKYPIEPGTIYVLDKHDEHFLRAFTEMQLACVFSPALHGTETHDANGSYPLPEPRP
jgi:L-ectoine synthase